MKARVTVTLKSGILDPQGKAIEGALKSLGVDGVASVRQGKVFDIELAGADNAKAAAAVTHAARVWHAETALPKGTDLVVVPGGFSYGDYLRCGAIAARAPVMDAVRKFAAGGGLVLGVCNGFQILCEAGLLPGVLMRNARLKFICKDVHLRVERSDTPFTRDYNAGQVIRVPVAHGEGNYEADEETVKRLEGEGRGLSRYFSPRGGGGEPSTERDD